MKKKRIAALLMTGVLAAGTVLTGCGEDAGKSTADNKETNKETEKDSEETDNKDASEEKDSEEVKVIKLGTGDDSLVMREMAERFEKTHPGVKIEFATKGGYTGNEQLAELAATGEMPDIITLENFSIAMQNDWIIDLKQYAEKDEDISKLPETFLKYGEIGDKLIMLPGSAYFYGLEVNKDLLAANGVEVPGYDWTFDEFVDIAKKVTKAGSSIGTSDVLQFLSYIPAQMNDELGWGSFNETTKQYEIGPEFEHGVAIVKELLDAKASLNEPMNDLGNPWDYEEGSTERQDVEDARTEYCMKTVGETDDGKALFKGKIGMRLDATWTMDFDGFEDYSGFDWDFYPFPVVEEGKQPRLPILFDSLAITTTCEHPEEAYEFIKYITFADEGIQDRLDIVKNWDEEAMREKYPDVDESYFYEWSICYSSLPLTKNPDLIEQWMEINGAKPGVRYMIEQMANGIVDGYKVTPGYADAYTNFIEKMVKEEVLTGKKTIADTADEMMEKANAITKEAYEIIGE